MAVPVPLGTEDRTARLTFRRPDHWQRETPSGADLRVTGDGVTATVRSRPSDLGIADESTALLGRLPGSVEGVLVVGCDVWTTAGAPARLVEYTLPAVDEGGDDTFVSHLLLTTGRHRIDLVVERPLRSLAGAPDAEDTVFALLDSVRATGPVPGGRSRDLEAFPEPHRPDLTLGPHLGTDAFATLTSLAGRRWNPATARTPGGRVLVESGLLGRFGTMPQETSALLAPLADGTEPTTLERTAADGSVSRLQAWAGPEDVTVVDGTDETGYAVAAVSPQRVVAMTAWRLDLRPAWTWPWKTGPVPADLLERRLAGGAAADLPAALAATDPRLARFWAAPWAVAHLRRPGRTAPVTVVAAEGVGFARVGRTEAGATAFSAAAPANLYRMLVRSVLGRRSDG